MLFRSIIKCRCKKSDINLCVLDIDFGCGIIRRGSQKLYTNLDVKECLNWEYFNENRKELLNLISVEEIDSI